jgi:histidine kinase
MFDQQFKVRGIVNDWGMDPHLPAIIAEPNRLEQVFVNLFINARDAIEEKGDLHVDGKTDKRVRIVTRGEDEAVIVEVCDSGVGIPPAIAEKIFEPFFTTKEVGKGTGLGLSIRYGIVSKLGGEIFVKPRTGGGACFVMRFPLKAGQNGTHDSAG